MPYDERLADRVRNALATRGDVEEKAMFGGLAFMVRGYMACGIVADLLMVRVGADASESLVDEPHVRPMDFTGTPLKGFLYVEPEGVETLRALRTWVDRSTRFVDGLPERRATAKRNGGRPTKTEATAAPAARRVSKKTTGSAVKKAPARRR